MLRSVASKVAWVGRTASMVFGLALVMALLFGVASTALGANGKPFILGKAANVATKVTGLVGRVAAGEALVVKNPSGGSALGLSVGDPLADPASKAVAPMKVDSQARVENLNADTVDGKSSEDFANTTHPHSGGDITSGTVEADRVEDGAGSNLNADQLDGMEPNRLPGSIAGVGTWAGSTPVIAGSSSTWVFVGPQATVTTTAGQRLIGAAQVPLGLPAGAGTQNFRYNLCYQPSVGGTLAQFNFNGYSIGHITPTRTSWTATAATPTMNTGTWKVGFCVLNEGTTAISNNDWVNGWVQVINEPVATTAAASKVATSNVQERQ